ncbi:MAG TPA: F0F1 ATP synthase subunit gamma [Aurantimonas sp.]|uniref:ATP synthase gamma chain n=1 Tax=Aurantimonas marianensis TaxID=2920428 RepID=A0A9X2HCH0_9HYPH|nr:F0F1 ATP synthase subunit gamma [Aurantimonas marianensis]MCP3055144.1 F0F1 ATP synthase subunit gamma [Aurantimonas marianensis]
MASLKDLRNRIASVKSTQKITKAMQMVAAAKLRRAEEAAQAARPYADRMAAVLANISGAMEGEGPPLMVGTGKDDVHLLVVFTADRGLCGGFNASIVKLARIHQRKLEGEGKTVKFVVVGKKGWDLMRRDLSSKVVERTDLREAKQVGFEHAEAIGQTIIDLFEKGEFDVCSIFYSEFENVITQTPTRQRVIPAALAEEDADLAGEATVYEYEPEPGAILEDLIPRNIKVQVLHALLENAASEQGARMSAMDNATRNAGDMIDRLSISYNRQRQAQITTELVEIISGAEAL